MQKNSVLYIYNTLTGTEEPFHPIIPGKVGIYVCGMTVYDYCHIGHARVMVVFDMITRYLRAAGYQVHYVRNITDIDDKIIQRAKENAEDIQSLTSRFIDSMHEDAAALGVLPPNEEPRATEHIPQIIAMIQRLLDNGYGYQTDHGDICFAINNYSDYGHLSGKDINKLRVGMRVDSDPGKRDPADFVLWKAAKADEPGWDSPWGEGRPGWHIECSAMSTCCLGDSFDIHGGGQDLQFPHHENEIAQSECATGKTFVRVWMHNGFVQIDEQKMSKSLGNFFTVREVMQHYSSEAIRFFILSSHYRSPLNYATDNLDEAEASLAGLYTTLRDCMPNNPKNQNMTETAIDEASHSQLQEYEHRFMDAMNNDFNTPQAIAVLHELERETRRTENQRWRNLCVGKLLEMAKILGILQSDPQHYLQGQWQSNERKMIENLIEERNQARMAKDFAAADRVRDQLLAMGITLEDTPQGTLWRKQMREVKSPITTETQN